MLSLLVIISDKSKNIESFENESSSDDNNNDDDNDGDDDDISENDINDKISTNKRKTDKLKKETSDVNIDLSKRNHHFSKMISLDLNDMKKHILSDR